MSVSVARDVTEKLRPPRTVFVPFQMGHVFGVPVHRALHRRVLAAMLELLESATESGVIETLPITWAQARREGKALEAGE